MLRPKKHTSNTDNKLPKKSMVLNQSEPLYQIPTSFSTNILKLELSHNRIFSLEGIQKYNQVQVINLRQNFITDFKQLNRLKILSRLRQLLLQQNPISQKLNYRYLIFLKLPQLCRIDGADLEIHSISQYKEWQHSIPHKITLFEQQKCHLLQDPSAVSPSVLQQMKQILTSLSYPSKNYPISQISTINRLIQDLFPLTSSVSLGPNSEHRQQIREYLLEFMTKIMAKVEPSLMSELLSNIETRNKSEQQRLVNDPQACVILVKQQLISEYQLNCLNEEHIDDVSNIKHYVSAETQIGSMERDENKSYKFVHFSMDQRYLYALTTFLKNELKTTIKYIVENTQDRQILDDHQRIQTFWETNKEEEQQSYQQYKEHSLGERIGQVSGTLQTQQNEHPYHNRYILGTLIDNLSRWVQKVVLNRIRAFNNQYIPILNNYSNIIQDKLIRYQHKQVQTALWHIFNWSIREIDQVVQQQKRKRLFMAWKRIKIEKIKLLRRIVKKKMKDDKFLVAIAYEKWRLNSRTMKLKKMSSQALLRGRNSHRMPVSKMGIEYEYQRIAKKYNF